VQSSRILLAEDFEDFRRFVCSVLQLRSEFQVAEASDGWEAVQKAEELQPDLILLDIGLPSLNGLAVARRVRKLVPAAKILFLSQESSPDVVQEALSLGDGYVYKPHVQSDLMPAIETVLKGERFVSRDLGINGRTEAARRHEVQFYSDDSVFLEIASHLIANALKSGNPAIVIATKSHREGLVLKLTEEGLDVNDAIQRGIYISLDAQDQISTVNTDAPDVDRFLEDLSGLVESAASAAKKDAPRIVVCAECSPLLLAQGHTNAAIQLEKVGNLLIQTHNVDILCAYPLSSFPEREYDHTFKKICVEHTAVFSR